MKISQTNTKNIPLINANPHNPNQDVQIGEYKQIKDSYKNAYEESAKNGTTNTYVLDGIEYTYNEIEKNPDLLKNAKTGKLTTKANNWTKTTIFGTDQFGSNVIETKYDNGQGSIFERTKFTKDRTEVREDGVRYNGEDKVYKSMAYDIDSGKMVWYSHDINLDDKNELEQYYENGRVVYERADNNSDGFIDRETKYDELGNIVYEFIDYNYNGTGKTKELINGKLKTTCDTRTFGEKISDWWHKRS